MLELDLSQGVFSEVDLLATISDCHPRTCHTYSVAFAAAAKAAEESSSERLRDAFSVMCAACSMYLSPDSPMEPLVPQFVSAEGWRTPGINDFSEQHLTVFRGLVPTIKDPEFRARIADIVWLRLRDHSAAESAISGYLDSAEGLLEIPHEPSGPVDRVTRAVAIAAQLGGRHPARQRVAEFIDGVIRSPERRQSWDVLSLLSIAYDRNMGEPAVYAHVAETLATEMAARGSWFEARALWANAEKWYRRAGETAKSNAATLAQAACYESEATAQVDSANPSYFRAASNIQCAIQVLRRVPATKAQQDRLHTRLLKYQERSLSELGRYQIPVDLTRTTQLAIEAIAGKSLPDALDVFLSSPPISLKQLRDNVTARSRNTMGFISSTVINNQGKNVGRRPGVMGAGTEVDAAGMRAAMFQDAISWRTMHIHGVIRPMLEQINLEHRIQLRDIESIVADNPFVPQDRVWLFSKGLHAGIIGEFEVAAHLLIPQIENSIRYVLVQRGIPTSSLNDAGIQSEYDLNRLLNLPEVKDIFDEDTIFDLQGLLVEHTGTNLRNLTAHGLLRSQAFYSTESVYLWWMTMKLCYVARILAIRWQNSQRGAEGGERPSPS